LDAVAEEHAECPGEDFVDFVYVVGEAVEDTADGGGLEELHRTAEDSLRHIVVQFLGSFDTADEVQYHGSTRNEDRSTESKGEVNPDESPEVGISSLLLIDFRPMLQPNIPP
jgi:hypothetical protein